MDTYTLLRQFADSWALAAMTAFYIGAILWVFRPGSRKAHDEAASLPFRFENAPGVTPDATKPADQTTKGKA
ncbi:cbb3-type cytochrome c oxidase subunit 3 [Paracoccus zhejiangensis]|uniref:CcoQ/FixQ family Cbb3-type cytochrome c oxidase assembly chaperone n=1 Tax=Paracoccus zhejiangensis TaxID=1077935 RepID=A0A2H5EVR1_9RHOB|nr:cbb3-type cytochrome c oxidase subunit 3 [Paracoccus zhejiangensis]AUH63392.1 CcoQ/FixQ family Cbb3-type cytochrome c oxidase assembly chaperone [Paracoccus zhejiangensis]